LRFDHMSGLEPEQLDELEEMVRGHLEKSWDKYYECYSKLHVSEKKNNPRAAS
jgi:hypothetical protein